MRPVIVFLLLFGAVLAGGCAHSEEGVAGAKPLYTCPMHPEYVSDKPGDCPICGMRLVLKEQAPAAPGASKKAFGDPAGHPPGPSGGERAGDRPAVPAVLDLGPDRAALAGVRTVEAGRGSLAQPVRAVGTVAVDETRVRQVTTKVAGFVERLHVNATGQMVRAGEPLFELYSPELLASQEEYLRARRSAEQFGQSACPRCGGAARSWPRRRGAGWSSSTCRRSSSSSSSGRAARSAPSPSRRPLPGS